MKRSEDTSCFLHVTFRLNHIEMKTNVLPKVIYSLWLQGEDNAPDLVKLNFKKWRDLNPSYTLIVLNEASCEQYINHLSIDRAQLSLQAKSDIIRLKLLHRHGGIWADASVLPTRPLAEWIDLATEQMGFFAYAREGTVLPISSWFLAARPSSLIITKWDSLVDAYWAYERKPIHTEGNQFQVPNDPKSIMLPFENAAAYPYFWVHHLFGILVETDEEFANCWANRTQKSALPPHALAEYFQRKSKKKRGLRLVKQKLQNYFGESQPDAIGRICNEAEMQKLDWRRDYQLALLANLR